MPNSHLQDLKSDLYWMQLALKQAKKAQKLGEVPIGAVLVHKDKLIASACNLTIQRNDPTAHAEILLLRKAATALKNYRLADTIVYVTMEPCPMCAGALLWARVKKVVFGCWDKKSGCCGSVLNFSKVRPFNHRLQVSGGVLEEECRQIVQLFFCKKR